MASSANTSELSLEIRDIAFPQGFGVARNGDFVCFVPGAIPGDVVRVKMTREEKRFGFARILAIEKESPFTVAPACPHAGACGGCAFQNLLYEKQLELKQNYLLQTLRRIGNVPLEQVKVESIVPSAEQYYYRSKVELFFGEHGPVNVGFRERVSPLEPYSGRLVPIQQCPIFSKSLERLLPLFSEYAGRVQAGARGKQTSRVALRKLIIREAKWNKRLMVSLVVEGNDMAEFPWLLREAQREVPEVASLWVISDRKREVLLGTPYVEEMIGQRTFRIYPQTFSQPNTRMAERLYESIAELCQAAASELVLGLYCGTGPIEISLSPFARKIVGVDSDAGNITTAIENCRINQVRNCQFYRQTAERASSLNISGPFDLIVVDPPRAGLTPEAVSFIKGLAVSRLIYVSCNPSTLARDLKRLREAGYKPRSILPFDFFPHGAHLETLVLLERG
ncbi:MAG TPA: 23S rRNA (uracil(1939)-C(5))-methyltransferase RlmD [Syntrophorhabdales bacterium]|nr:23S rRNA (uracil(1939)-C(5))-methyltransferase RlmD [Syntrophorhabdales bacterium]